MGIRATHIHKVLGDPPNKILTDITLDIRDGDYLSVTGRSGSGKSTLLYLLSTLDNVSGGTIEIDDQPVEQMSSAALSLFRNRRAGFVFQFHYLISELTALENVLLPARKVGQNPRYRERALYLLDQFGISNKQDRLPRHLSGGEQQRVAIARALIMEPRYLFADEPTGLLDSENSETVLRIIEETNKTFGTTVILVTHEPTFAKRATHQIHLVDGRITAELGPHRSH